MKIIGYSERGLLNSLFYEIAYSPISMQLVNELVSLISFPYRDVEFPVKDITIFVEQSFSDYGDADALLLMDNDSVKQSLFIEAKVKTYNCRSWSIEGEYNGFKEGVRKNKISSSNLFTQLYTKVRLFSELKKGGIESLQKGVSFPSCSSKRIRKIGNNKVVLKAVEKIMKYSDEAFYISLIPDNSSNVEDFYLHKLQNYKTRGFEDWNLKNWGYLTWEGIEKFCKQNHLSKTQELFKFNEGQVY